MSANLDYTLYTDRLVGAGHPSLADTINRPLKELTGTRLQVITDIVLAGDVGVTVTLPTALPSTSYAVFPVITESDLEKASDIGSIVIPDESLALNAFVVYNTGDTGATISAFVICLA